MLYHLKYTFAVAFSVASCNLQNEQFVTQKEIRTENINGGKKQVTIIKTLKKQNKSPVSIFTKAQNNKNIKETMDSFFYDAKGNILYSRSFVKKNGDWVLSKPGN